MNELPFEKMPLTTVLAEFGRPASEGRLLFISLQEISELGLSADRSGRLFAGSYASQNEVCTLDAATRAIRGRMAELAGYATPVCGSR